MATRRGQSNGFNADGSLMNVGNQIWDPAKGGRPSIRLYPEYSSGVAMAALLSCEESEPIRSNERRAPAPAKIHVRADTNSSGGDSNKKVSCVNTQTNHLSPACLEVAAHDGLSLGASASTGQLCCEKARPKRCPRPLPSGIIRKSTSLCTSSSESCLAKGKAHTPKNSVRPSFLSGLPQKPKVVVCHLCNGEFGSASIDIHVRRCQKKLDAASIAAEAKSTRQSGKEGPRCAVLLPKTVSCPICARSFGPNSIDVHIPLCRRKHPSAKLQQPESNRKPSARRVREAPKRGCVSSSGAKVQLGSAQDHTREFCQRSGSVSSAERDSREAKICCPAPLEEQRYVEVPSDWSEDTLIPCPQCNRTFLPDRLPVHLRGCRVGSIKVVGNQASHNKAREIVQRKRQRQER